MSRRTPLVVIGAVVLALGSLTAVTGIALAVLFGSGDALATGPHRVTTPTRALVSDVATVNGLSSAPSGLGQARIEIDATTRSDRAGAFVGVARVEDVDRYLAGADIDVVEDFDVAPFHLGTQHRTGSAAPAAPGEQSFWVARAEARSGTARLSWPMRDGDYRIVLMNADASAGVDLDGRFGIALPSALAISMITLASGLGVALVGGVLLTVGLVASRPAGPTPPPGAPRPPVPAPARAADARPAAYPPVDTRQSRGQR